VQAEKSPNQDAVLRYRSAVNFTNLGQEYCSILAPVDTISR